MVSNPPYSQNWEPPEPGEDIRFEYGIAPKSKADYAFLLHDLYHLRDDGIMTIVLPHGVLFRGGEEGTIRRNLVENHHIQAIIGLPANIFFGTGIPTIVMVLRKHRNDDHVLVVDASKYFAKDGKNNKLRASDIKRIVDTVSENRDVDKFSRLVSLDEIRQNDYNLNIPRYVDSSETAESWDVYSTMFGGIPKQDIDALNKYWNVFPGLRQRLFAEENGHSAKLAVRDVREAVNADSGVSAYIQRYREVFTDYPSYLRGELVGNAVNVSIAAEEEVLANDLLHRLADVPLVDAYTAYQVLDDSWQKTIANDLETIQSEGHDAVRKVDANMVVKKKSGKDVEVQDGWAGHILPFDLVQEKLLSADLAEIGTYESRLTEISSEIADILENLDEDDKNSTDAVSEDGDSFVATELKKAVKSIGRDPETDFDRALVNAQRLFDEEREVKKNVKNLRSALDEKTRAVIEGLSDEQADDLLAAKWVEPLQHKLEELPQTAVDELIASVNALNDKYSTTYSDVCEQIEQAEAELGNMLGQLTGNEFDMAGIAELKTLLGGE